MESKSKREWLLREVVIFVPYVNFLYIKFYPSEQLRHQSKQLRLLKLLRFHLLPLLLLPLGWVLFLLLQFVLILLLQHFSLLDSLRLPLQPHLLQPLLVLLRLNPPFFVANRLHCNDIGNLVICVVGAAFDVLGEIVLLVHVVRAGSEN